MKKPKACIFDAFGTLFNLSIPTDLINQKANGKGAALLDIWRSKQLEYTWLRSLMGSYVPFEKVTEEALTFAMRSVGATDRNLYQILMPVYRKANAFKDVKPALQRLQLEGITTAILSNGTPSMLKAGAENAGITDWLDAIISVDTIQKYKPSPEVYQLALDTLDLEAEEVLFFSSNQWDIAGAGQFGLPTVWVDRYGKKEEVLPPKARYKIKGLGEIEW